jgi:hypothetical protein
MRVLLTIAFSLSVPVLSHGQGAKACEDLKSEIAAKLDAKGVKGYALDVVSKDQDAEGKVVGTCEGGSKKIIYRKSGAAAKAPAKDSSQQ